MNKYIGQYGTQLSREWLCIGVCVPVRLKWWPIFGVALLILNTHILTPSWRRLCLKLCRRRAHWIQEPIRWQNAYHGAQTIDRVDLKWSQSSSSSSSFFSIESSIYGRWWLWSCVCLRASKAWDRQWLLFWVCNHLQCSSSAQHTPHRSERITTIFAIRSMLSTFVTTRHTHTFTHKYMRGIAVARQAFRTHCHLCYLHLFGTPSAFSFECRTPSGALSKHKAIHYVGWAASSSAHHCARFPNRQLKWPPPSPKYRIFIQ